MRRLPTVRHMLLDIFLEHLNLIPVHLVQDVHHEFDIADQPVASCAAEVFAHNDAEEFQAFGVRRHSVGGDDPGATAQLMRDGKFVVVFVLGGVEAKSDEGEAVAGFFGHDDEA